MSETAGSQRPLQLRIVDSLRARIDAGEFPPGARLPSVRTLMAEFDVSTQTAQNAIGVLKRENVVESIPGKGVFVKEQRELISRTASYLPPGAGGAQPLHHGAMLFVDVREVEPPEDVAAALRIAPGETAVLRRVVMGVNREPTEIVSSYFPTAVARGTALAESTLTPDESVDELVRLGFRPSQAAEVVQVNMPTPDEARMLRLVAGVAVFRVWRSVHDGNGQVLAVESSVLSGDRYQLLYKLPIHD